MWFSIQKKLSRESVSPLAPHPRIARGGALRLEPAAHNRPKPTTSRWHLPWSGLVCGGPELSSALKRVGRVWGVTAVHALSRFLPKSRHSLITDGGNFQYLLEKTMKLIHTPDHLFLKEIVEAFLEGNTARMRELQHRRELCEARRQLWTVIRNPKIKG